MSVNKSFGIKGQNKWERRKQEFLAGHWETKEDYIKEKKIGRNANMYSETKNWDFEKNDLLKGQTESVKLQVMEANAPIKVACLQGKAKIIKDLYTMIMTDEKKDLKAIMFAYHVFKVELGEPENITRNLNEAVADVLPDDILDKLKENALNAARGNSDLSRASNQPAEA